MHQTDPLTLNLNSSPSSHSELCSICYETKERSCSPSIDALRPQLICYECWHSHIKNYICRITYRAGQSILSPFNDGNPIDVAECLGSLRTDHAREIEEMIFRKYCAFNREVDKCPSQTCDFVYIGEKCKWGSKENIYNCPKCEMPLTPNNPYSPKSLLASFYLIMANKCPKCDIPIEKISGCPHMTCPCGHHFCWYCYKDHPSGTIKRIYQLHNIPECAFIFLSKIVLFIICCVNLLVVWNGNWVMRSVFGGLAIVFSVLWRAVVMDGFILVQVIYFVMQRRRRNLYYSFTQTRNMVAMALLVNLIGIGALYWLDQLVFFMEILVGELVLALLGFGVGYGVVYSVETWFEFVA